MKILLIMFYVEKGLQDTLIQRIKNLGSWARINTNVWCIMSYDKTEKTIREILKYEIGDEGRLFVIDITDSSWASSNLPNEVTKRLKVWKQNN